MKKIKIRKLVISNFKGIKDLTIEFDKKETSIYGKNTSGKTTVSDSFSWLLEGKNSNNQEKFNIKTLDENNNAIPNLCHSVEGVFDVDGTEIIFKRVYMEKRSKIRGTEEFKLSHTTDYYVNEVPSTLIEYNTKINTLISDDLRKILSSPLFFNDKLEWKQRRSILSSISGEVSNNEVLELLSENNRLEIEKLFATDKSLVDYKKEFVSKRKKIKEELEQLPPRIDEASKSIPESKNWTEIEFIIQLKENEDRN